MKQFVAEWMQHSRLLLPPLSLSTALGHLVVAGERLPLEPVRPRFAQFVGWCFAVVAAGLVRLPLQQRKPKLRLLEFRLKKLTSSWTLGQPLELVQPRPIEIVVDDADLLGKGEHVKIILL